MIGEFLFLDKNTCPSCMDEEVKDFEFCESCLARLDRVDFSEYVDDLGMDLTYPLFYNAFTKDLLWKFKFRGQTHLYRPLGKLMYEAGLERGVFDRVDLLVPMPLHWKKQRQRGYNQSLLLAEEISRLGGIPLREDLFVKIKPTRAQHDLPIKERMTNLQGSIKAQDPVYKYRVLVVDDVVTSGASLKSLVQALDQDPIYMEALVLTSGQRIDY